MSHYFIYDPKRDKNIIEIEGTIKDLKYHFSTDNGIFSFKHVDVGTTLLIETLKINENCKSVLDLGCGYGVIGIVLKRENEQLLVTQSDINERAVELTKINNKRYGFNNKVLVSNGFSEIKEKFDLITLNPPIKAGKSIIFEMYKDSINHLNKNGEFYVVVKKNHGAQSHLSFLQNIYENSAIIKKSKGFYVIKSKK